MKPAILLCMVRGVDHMAAALLARADIEIITLYDLTSDVLERKGIPHRRLNDFLSDEIRARAMRGAETRVRAVLEALRADIRAPGGSGVLRSEYGFDDGTWASVRAAVGEAVQRDIVEELAVIEVVHRIARETDLRLVFVPEDICRDTKTAVSAAQRIGVPALHLLHGFPYGTTNAHDTVTADVIAAYSARAKAIYESFGADPARVIVTGNPLWDIYASPPMPGWKERTCGMMGLDPGRPIIEYALTNVHRFSAVSINHPVYHIESAEAVMDAFAILARRHPDWQFALRTHPSDSGPTEHLTERARRAGLESVCIDTQLPYDAVAVVDTLLCTHSNLGVEAILFGKPVINVAIDAIGGPVFREGMGPLFLEDDAVLWARQPDEIAPAIEAALLDPDTQGRLLDARPHSIEQFNYANDGKATERVCALALDMVARNGHYVRPVERWPAFEPALAGAVPGDAQTVLVAGRAARHVAGALAWVRAGVDVTVEPAVPEAGAFDAVVLADPLPHTAGAEARLSDAAARLPEDGGTVIAGVRNGASAAGVTAFARGAWVPPKVGGDRIDASGEFSWPGVEIALSRAGLELRDWTFVPGSVAEPAGPASRQAEGWVVQAARRTPGPGPLGAEHREQQRRAREANALGEAKYAEGDVPAAAKAFAEAARTWNGEALYFNNLATALHALQRPDEAWERLLDALHLNPNLQAARANLRMVGAALGRTAEAERLLGRFGADRE
ncbi:MAG: hypothetical protein JXR94_03215 [Candidatus Hydrogenedentes bacterium]|nr:hypothetical protein [Candidatus Hydrogenedentota bacterium]